MNFFNFYYANERTLKCVAWEEDLQFLSQEGNLVTNVHYYTKALSHSNLFDAYINRIKD